MIVCVSSKEQRGPAPGWSSPRHQNHCPSFPLPVPARKQLKSPLCLLTLREKELWAGTLRGFWSTRLCSLERRKWWQKSQRPVRFQVYFSSLHSRETTVLIQHLPLGTCISLPCPRSLNSAGNDCPKARVEERKEQNSSTFEGKHPLINKADSPALGCSTSPPRPHLFTLAFTSPPGTSVWSTD